MNPVVNINRRRAGESFHPLGINDEGSLIADDEQTPFIQTVYVPTPTTDTGTPVAVVNNVTTTDTGSALDASQGKVLKDQVDAVVVTANAAQPKQTGKGLSTNDYSNADQAKVANTSGTNTGDQTLSQSGQRVTLSGNGGGFDLPASGTPTPIANNLTTTAAGNALDATQGKALKDQVDAVAVTANAAQPKQTGKGLSTNDYSNADQAKVASTSGTNTGDQTLTQSGQRVTLSGNGGAFDLPTAGSPTPIANNLTTTATGSALDAAQGKALKDQVDAVAVTANAAQPKQTGKGLSTNDYTTADKTKVASMSGTNTGDQTLTQSGQRVTLSGNGGFFDLPTPSTPDLYIDNDTIVGDSTAAAPLKVDGNSSTLLDTLRIALFGIKTMFKKLQIVGGLNADIIHLTGGSNAETNKFSIEAVLGFGLKLVGGFMFNQDTMYHTGNGNLKTDGNYLQTSQNKKYFYDATGMGINNDTNPVTSTLYLNGSFGTAITTKVATYTPTVNDHTILYDATAGAITSTLPSAVGIGGREYVLKRINGGSNTVTLNANGSEKIDGVGSITLSAQNKYTKLQSDNIGWQIVGGNI